MKRCGLLVLFGMLLVVLSGCSEDSDVPSESLVQPEPRPVHITITGEAAEMNLFDPLIDDLLPEWQPADDQTDPGFAVEIATTVHRFTCTYANYSDIEITWIDAAVTLTDQASGEVMAQDTFWGSNPGCPDRTTGATYGDPDIAGIRSLVLGQLTAAMGYRLQAGTSTHERFLAARTVIVSPDGTRVLAPHHRENEAAMLDAGSLETLYTLTQNEHFRASAFNADGTLLATVNKEAARLIDVATGDVVQQFPTGGGDAYGVGFHPNGTHVMAAAGYSVYVWNLGDGSLQWQYDDEELLTHTTYSADGKYILINTRLKGRVVILNAGTGAIVMELDGYGGREIQEALISPDERYLAITMRSNMSYIVIWDIAKGEEVTQLAGDMPQEPYHIYFSPDSKYVLATYLTNDPARLWRTKNWQPVNDFPPLNINRADFTPDGRYLIVDQTGDVWIYDTRDWSPVYWLIGHPHSVYQAVTDPQQTVLFSTGSHAGGQPRALRRWEVPALAR